MAITRQNHDLIFENMRGGRAVDFTSEINMSYDDNVTYQDGIDSSQNYKAGEVQYQSGDGGASKGDQAYLE